jgi:hypothetical protein
MSYIYGTVDSIGTVPADPVHKSWTSTELNMVCDRLEESLWHYHDHSSLSPTTLKLSQLIAFFVYIGGPYGLATLLKTDDGEYENPVMFSLLFCIYSLPLIMAIMFMPCLRRKFNLRNDSDKKELIAPFIFSLLCTALFGVMGYLIAEILLDYLPMKYLDLLASSTLPIVGSTLCGSC